MNYFLKIWDNFNYMDEDEAFDYGNYETTEEAGQAARKIVADFITNAWAEGTHVDELIEHYKSFGDDPAICSHDPNINPPSFSAWHYAESIVSEMKEILDDLGCDIQETYQKCILFASAKHAEVNQIVPGTNLPYVIHLSDVAMEILIAGSQSAGFNIKLSIQLALLHDTIEDTDTTLEELEEKFGLVVLVCVKALTKDKSLPKEQQMQDSLDRIKKLPKEVWAVKLADRITNMQKPPAKWDIQKKIAYQAEAQIILEALGSGNEYLGKRLDERIKDYSKYL